MNTGKGLFVLLAIVFTVTSARAGHFDDDPKDTPLHKLIRSGRDKEAIRLIKRGVEVNGRNYLGYAPLHNAASKGNLVVMRALMVKGADVNITDNEGQTPLDKAVAKEQFGAVALLRVHGAGTCAELDL